MKIEVKYKESETNMYIYGFEVYSNFKVEHVSTMISCRNDKNDVWGHLWSSKYKKDFKKEYDELLKKNHYLEDYEVEELYEYGKLKDKYNPVYNKTINGDTYYSGCSFSSRGAEDEKYKLKISKDKIKEIILKQLTKKIKVV